MDSVGVVWAGRVAGQRKIGAKETKKPRREKGRGVKDWQFPEDQS
jgi:hypothetical protein